MMGGRNEIIQALRLYLRVALSSIILVGCGTTMVTTPEVEPLTDVGFRLLGKIVYDGNREYLPRTITDGETGLTFQYTYYVTHGKDNVPQLLPLFNPLTILGFPIGEDTLVVTGRLEILSKNVVVKTFTATSGFEKTRNVFWQGETFAELRRTGLLAVKDNIEAQMYRERDLLSRLATAD